MSGDDEDKEPKLTTSKIILAIVHRFAVGPFGPWVFFGLLIGFWLWIVANALGSEKLEDLILQIYRDPPFAWGGWLILPIALVTFASVAIWQRNSSDYELKRLRKENQRLRSVIDGKTPELDLDDENRG